MRLQPMLKAMPLPLVVHRLSCVCALCQSHTQTLTSASQVPLVPPSMAIGFVSNFYKERDAFAPPTNTLFALCDIHWAKPHGRTLVIPHSFIHCTKLLSTKPNRIGMLKLVCVCSFIQRIQTWKYLVIVVHINMYHIMLALPSRAYNLWDD